MIIECAPKAECMPTSASYRGYNSTEVLLLDLAVHCKLAVWCRAPLEVIEVVDVGTGEEFVVSAYCQRCLRMELWRLTLASS